MKYYNHYRNALKNFDLKICSKVFYGLPKIKGNPKSYQHLYSNLFKISRKIMCTSEKTDYFKDYMKNVDEVKFKKEKIIYTYELSGSLKKVFAKCQDTSFKIPSEYEFKLDKDCLLNSFLNRSYKYNQLKEIMIKYIKKKEALDENNKRDKVCNPIIAVVGIPGQGKTSFLNNSVFFEDINKMIEAENLLPVIIEFNKNQDFDITVEDHPNSVINMRIFHKIFGKYLKMEYKSYKKFVSKFNRKKIFKMDSESFIILILQAFKKQGIFLLVDELSKIRNDALRQNVITNLGFIKSGSNNQVIISSLDSILVKNASTKSQRPVESIYLQAIGDVVKLIVNHKIEKLNFLMEREKGHYKYLNLLQFIGEVSVTPRICNNILQELIFLNENDKSKLLEIENNFDERYSLFLNQSKEYIDVLPSNPKLIEFYKKSINYSLILQNYFINKKSISQNFYVEQAANIGIFLGSSLNNKPILSKWGILFAFDLIQINPITNPGLYSFIDLLKTDFAKFNSNYGPSMFEIFCSNIEIILRNFISNSNDLFNNKNRLIESKRLYNDSYGISEDEQKIWIEKGYKLSDDFSNCKYIIDQNDKKESLFDYMTEKEFSQWENNPNKLFKNIENGKAFDYVTLDKINNEEMLVSFIEVKLTTKDRYPNNIVIKDKLDKMNEVFIKLKQKYDKFDREDKKKLTCRAIFYTTLENTDHLQKEYQIPEDGLKKPIIINYNLLMKKFGGIFEYGFIYLKIIDKLN